MCCPNCAMSAEVYRLVNEYPAHTASPFMTIPAWPSLSVPLPRQCGSMDQGAECADDESNGFAVQRAASFAANCVSGGSRAKKPSLMTTLLKLSAAPSSRRRQPSRTGVAIYVPRTHTQQCAPESAGHGHQRLVSHLDVLWNCDLHDPVTNP